MLKWRIILGVSLVAALAGLCVWDAKGDTPGAVMFPVALVVTLAATQEVMALFRALGIAPTAWATYLGTLLVVAAQAPLIFKWHGLAIGPDGAAGPLAWPLIGLAAGFFVVVLAEIARYERPGMTCQRFGAASFALIYVGVLMSFLVLLRTLDGGRHGFVPVISLIAVVKGGDIGAYTVGRMFGRHKMAPVISPGKTWEGAAGGVLFACAASWLSLRYVGGESYAAGWGWLVYGIVVGVVGMLGDLAESLLKRDAGRKDSSDWLPGFGGVLDILDSILLAAPVAYVGWLFLLL